MKERKYYVQDLALVSTTSITIQTIPIIYLTTLISTYLTFKMDVMPYIS